MISQVSRVDKLEEKTNPENKICWDFPRIVGWTQFSNSRSAINPEMYKIQENP